jgi:hypothetical protein
MRCTRSAFALRIAAEVKVAYGLEEDLRCKVFGLFTVSDLAVDVVINEVEVFLIEYLEFRYAHGGTPGDGYVDEAWKDEDGYNRRE